MEVKWLKVSQLVPNSYNPNVMDEETYEPGE